MEKQNINNQPNRIKRNPTRFNTNVNQGKTNEKTYDEQTADDRSRNNNSFNDESDVFNSGEATNQADGQIDENKNGFQQGGQFNQQQ